MASCSPPHLLFVWLLFACTSCMITGAAADNEDLKVYARAGSDSIEVSWDNITGADSYLVSWAPSATDGANSTTTSDLQYDIINLEPCTAYMATVEARSGTTSIVQDSDAAVTTPITPSRVQNLQVTQEGCVLSVVWDAPGMNTGNCPLSYLVNWDINRQPGGQDTTTDTSYNITDLVTNAIYTVSVAATTGGFSSPAERRDTTTDILGAPENLTMEASQDSLQVTWQQPQEPCYEITAYRVSWQFEDGSEAGAIDLNSTTTECTILDLSPCVDYFVFVSAVSNEVPGTPASDSETTSAVVPGRPTSLILEQGVSTITVVWDPPAEDEGAACVDQYEVTWADTQNSDDSATVNQTTYMYIIAGLQPKTTYEVTVKAHSEKGWGDPATETKKTNSESNDPNVGAIVGGVIGGLVLVAAVAGAVYYRKKNNGKQI